ncbi:penicillin-binding protein activator [Hypericibacter adhaerens]|uniref:Penicillin-binding protein activator n=2 Tax=Hypericibacter adhaerens TaxID=2602016 RepID=A0A5J6N573_9PROT|nr:penicillin-binding protein activator [Hypericibacter adhaerens]
MAASLLAACAQKTVTTPPPSQQATEPVPAPAPEPAPAPAPTPTGPAKVGLLLPLSGPNAGLGQAMLNAAEMALFESGSDNLSLEVRDSEQMGGATAASQQLVAAGVETILGPVFASGVAQAAPAARTAQVPLISFSTDKSVAGNGVYVMGILPQVQVDRVVRYAATRGYKRVAALVPDSAFGRAVTGQLQQTLLATGGNLAQVQFYPPGTSDFSPFLEKLGAAKGSFDALLIPEGADVLRTVAPLLSYYGMEQTTVHLLGTSLWNDQSLLREPSLVGGLFAAPASEAWAGFADRYRSNYGAQPPRIASLAYDATLLAAALTRDPAHPRIDNSILTGPDGFSGIDGIFRFRPDGGVDRGLAVFEIQNGAFGLVDPAPQSFPPPGV